MLKLLHGEKKHALSRGHLGCLGQVATINTARGCGAGCLFCYARCVSGAPPAGSLLLYQDLPRQLTQQLDHRRGPPPPFVLYSTASDPFIGPEEVLRLNHECLKILVEHQIGIALSTRGVIPPATLELLARHRPFCRITLPISSLSDEYTRRWEPRTPLPRVRLFQLQQLREAQIAVEVRIDPLIPFVNDNTDDIRGLLSALTALEVDRAVLSFLHLRPGVVEQLQHEAPPDVAPLVLGGFIVDEGPSQEVPKFLHLPHALRAASLRRLQRIATKQGMHLSACHCQNPGIPARPCAIQPPELPNPRGEQLPLLE